MRRRKGGMPILKIAGAVVVGAMFKEQIVGFLTKLPVVGDMVTKWTSNESK